MKKRSAARGPIRWLPVDSRLFTPFLSLGDVPGIIRVFLWIELVLSSLVVVGSLILAALYFFR